VEIHLLAIQARILLWVGLSWIILGLYLGTDPATVAVRAAIAGLVAMWIGGWLVRRVAGVIEERVAADLAAAQLQALQAAEAQAQALTKAGKPPARAGRPGK
jgi:hypothetical protein